MNKFDFFKEWHYREIDRSRELKKNLQFYLFILITLISSFFLLFSKVFIDSFNVCSPKDYIALIVSGWILIFTFISAIYLIKIFFSSKKGKLIEDLDNPYNEKLQESDEKVEKVLINTFKKCIKNNCESNTLKEDLYYTCRIHLILAILGLFFFGFLYFFISIF